MPRFRNRRDAGRSLAALLETYRAMQPVVLALPRGGVPVAYEIAKSLEAPLDVFLVRRLTASPEDEVAIGAIASGGATVLNHDIIAQLGLLPSAVDRIVARETRELKRREALYRPGKPLIPVRDRAVILVDDGMATGASMRVAIEALRAHQPRSITVAVPVASRQALTMMRNRVDDWACVIAPEPFHAVGAWYTDFAQIEDDEVCALLARAAAGFDRAPQLTFTG